MKNSTKDKPTNTQDNNFLIRFYKLLKEEVKAPSYAWFIFLFVLTFFPLLTSGFQSIRNIFAVNVSILDFKVIVDIHFLWLLKVILPFLISLFFFTLFSYVFFMIRDKGSKRKYFFIFHNDDKEQDIDISKGENDKEVNKNFPFGFGVSCIDANNSKNVDKNEKIYIYHNLFSLATICNLLFWLSVMIVTLYDAGTGFLSQVEKHQAFDVVNNGLLLIECCLIIVLYKPFLYSDKYCIIIQTIAWLINFIVSSLVVISISNIDVFTFDNIEVLNVLVTTCIIIFVLFAFYSLLRIYNLHKNHKSHIKNESKKPNECKPDSSYLFIKYIHRFQIIFSLILLLLIVSIIKDYNDSSLGWLYQVISILIVLSIYVVFIRIFVFVKKDREIPLNQNTTIVNIQFYFLTGFIISLALMSPNSPMNISVIFPEALYILLIGATLALIVLFLKSYFYTARITMLMPLVAVLYFVGYIVQDKLVYILMFSLSILVLFFLNLKKIKLIECTSEVKHFFEYDTKPKTNGTDESNRSSFFPIFFISAITVFYFSTPNGLLSTLDHPKISNLPLSATNDNDSQSVIKLDINKVDSDFDYIVVVSAQGGGIAASAWTAKVLEELEKISIYDEKEHILNNFSNHLKAISAVSGGSLGGFYYYVNLVDYTKRLAEHIEYLKSISICINESECIKEIQRNSKIYEYKKYLKSIANSTADEIHELKDKSQHPVYNIASRNSLKAIMWGIANPMISIKKEAALVSRWIKKVNKDNEQEFKTINGYVSNNLKSFINKNDKTYNVYFIANSTYQETGKRVLISNYSFNNLDDGSCKQNFKNVLDSDYSLALNSEQYIKGINAVLHSATFPYVTSTQSLLLQKESLAIAENENYHLADGGYVDNYGVRGAVDFIKDYYCSNMLEYKQKPLKVILLQINTFGEPKSPNKSSDISSSVFGPISTLNNSRNSQKALNTNLIKQLKNIDGIDLESVEFLYESDNSNEASLPVSWQLLRNHKKQIENKWNDILYGYLTKKSTNSNKEPINPIIRLELAINKLKQGKPKSGSKPVCKEIEQSSIKECVGYTEIQSDLNKIKDDTKEILNKLNSQLNILNTNFSDIINCPSDIRLSSKIFNKGEPEVKTGVFNKEHFISCEGCESTLSTLESNNGDSIQKTLDKYKTNTTWHILGLTSSKGDFNYNANLAERRIFLYKSALEKYYERHNLNKPNIIEHPFGEIMSALEKNQTEEQRRRVYLIPCENPMEKSS